MLLKEATWYSHVVYYRIFSPLWQNHRDMTSIGNQSLGGFRLSHPAPPNFYFCCLGKKC